MPDIESGERVLGTWARYEVGQSDGRKVNLVDSHSQQAPGNPRPPGLMLHSAFEDDGQVKTVEVWASAEDLQRLSSSPGMVAGLAGEGHPHADDVKIIPLITADIP